MIQILRARDGRVGTQQASQNAVSDSRNSLRLAVVACCSPFALHADEPNLVSPPLPSVPLPSAEEHQLRHIQDRLGRPAWNRLVACTA
jgi:hypothetical protein